MGRLKSCVGLSDLPHKQLFLLVKALFHLEGQKTLPGTFGPRPLRICRQVFVIFCNRDRNPVSRTSSQQFLKIKHCYTASGLAVFTNAGATPTSNLLPITCLRNQRKKFCPGDVLRTSSKLFTKEHMWRVVFKKLLKHSLQYVVLLCVFRTSAHLEQQFRRGGHARVLILIYAY